MLFTILLKWLGQIFSLYIYNITALGSVLLMHGLQTRCCIIYLYCFICLYVRLCVFPYTHTIQSLLTDRQTVRQTDRRTDEQIHKKATRRKDIQTDKQTVDRVMYAMTKKGKLIKTKEKNDHELDSNPCRELVWRCQILCSTSRPDALFYCND